MQPTEPTELTGIMKKRNAGGLVYACDIRKWVKVDAPSREIGELQEKITELAKLAELAEIGRD